MGTPTLDPIADSNTRVMGGYDASANLLRMVAVGTDGSLKTSFGTRNQTNYFMALPLITTATDTLQSLTGYKSNATVVATTTPAVVSAGKKYRLQKVAISYIATATAGAVQVTLRANVAGVVAIGSPAVDSWTVGGNAAIAGAVETIVIDIPDGIEFAAGTGIGISALGLSATGTAAAAGYVSVSLSGFEY